MKIFFLVEHRRSLKPYIRTRITVPAALTRAAWRCHRHKMMLFAEQRREAPQRVQLFECGRTHSLPSSSGRRRWPLAPFLASTSLISCHGSLEVARDLRQHGSGATFPAASLLPVPRVAAKGSLRRSSLLQVGVISTLESHWVVLDAELSEIRKDYAALRTVRACLPGLSVLQPSLTSRVLRACPQLTRKYGEFWNRSLQQLKKQRAQKENLLKECAMAVS